MTTCWLPLTVRPLLDQHPIIINRFWVRPWEHFLEDQERSCNQIMEVRMVPATVTLSPIQRPFFFIGNLSKSVDRPPGLLHPVSWTGNSQDSTGIEGQTENNFNNGERQIKRKQSSFLTDFMATPCYIWHFYSIMYSKANTLFDSIIHLFRKGNKKQITSFVR